MSNDEAWRIVIAYESGKSGWLDTGTIDEAFRVIWESRKKRKE